MCCMKPDVYGIRIHNRGENMGQIVVVLGALIALGTVGVLLYMTRLAYES